MENLPILIIIGILAGLVISYNKRKRNITLQETIVKLQKEMKDTKETANKKKLEAKAHVKECNDRYEQLIASAEIVDLDSSIIYQKELDKARETQKYIINHGDAVILPDITFDGSKAKGMALMKKVSKLVLRAFDYETKDAIRNVKPGNLEATGMKIGKTAGVISRILQPQFSVEITQYYINAKLAELTAYHKHALAKQAEKEAKAAIRDDLREQAKAEQEHATAVQQADDQAKVAQRAYDNALSTLKDQHSSEIQLLKQKLDEALEMKERAKSQAQLTKAGHIYVIKNTGSFGHGIHKVGLTRRLVPMDRVKELGDASVPFPFAVNAMFYTENAPEMEKALHKALHKYRVNKVNTRKEFFEVPLHIIETEARNLGITVKFITSPEELEWAETQRQQST